MYTYDISTQDVEAGGLEVLDLSLIHSEFKASLEGMTTLFHKIDKGDLVQSVDVGACFVNLETRI